MRHHNSNRKFGRETGVRRALLRSLAANLLIHGKIETTEARAKELRSFVEKLVTTGKKGTLAARRIVQSRLATDAPVPVLRLMKEWAPKYADRHGGYTRVVKMGRRTGSDGAPLAIIEFV